MMCSCIMHISIFRILINTHLATEFLLHESSMLLWIVLLVCPICVLSRLFIIYIYLNSMFEILVIPFQVFLRLFDSSVSVGFISTWEAWHPVILPIESIAFFISLAVFTSFPVVTCCLILLLK